MRLIDYIKGNRRGKEANRLEREAMSDPFLQEALEGFDAVKGSHADAIHRLESKVMRRASASSRRKRMTWWSAAATVLLMIGFGSYFMKQKEDNHRQLTVKQIVKMPRQIAKVETMPAKPRVRYSMKFVPPVIRTDEEVNEEYSVVNESISEIHTSVATESIDAIAEVDVPQPTQIPVAASAKDTLTNEIKGKVVDQAGQPLVGASIQIAQSKMSTLTNMNGEFHLKAEKPDSANLTASYIGYKRKTVNVRGNNTIIKLDPEINSLAEVTTYPSFGAKKKSSDNQYSTVRLLNQSPVFGENEFKIFFSINAKRELCGTAPDSATVEFFINTNNRPSVILITNYSCQKAKSEVIKWLKKSPDWSTKNKKIKIDLKW